ncbi:dTDP-4-dehydrorhamnose 3,5-epimerase family protein [Nonomuraea sp. NPDC050643]|uniref:dTDP-4-dehydrorhamnose 3,5-epimerase family protein n=1 Tax=Nonomuraea sp. NPDC050643 TaxID=3155660 RepID=UPI003404225B
MKARPLSVAGAFAFTPEVFPDPRGVFVSPFQEAVFAEVVGHRLFPVAQTSQSSSRRGVIRGVHYTLAPPGTAKYVCCTRGSVLDFAVDLRVGSPTFGAWEQTELDGEGYRSVYFPPGVGHAFVTLEDDTVITYLLSERYVRENELAISPFDPAIGLPMPAGPAPLRSERDRLAPTLEQAGKLGLLPDYAACLKAELRFHD